MVGILLLTHAPLGQAFIAAAGHVFRAPPAQIAQGQSVFAHRCGMCHREGGTGTFIWYDPVIDTACVLLADREFDEWGMEHWPQFNSAVLRCQRHG